MAFIKINKQNFYHNLNQIALKTGSIDKIAIVLKDNAYGHGLLLVAWLASEYGVKHAVVNTIADAEMIEGLFKSILILEGTAKKHKVFSFAVNTLDDIKSAEPFSIIEMNINTGMADDNISLDEIDEALKLIRRRDLRLIGVMTHYHNSDILSSEFFWQTKHFEEAKHKVKKAGFKSIRVHSYNSASILRVKHFEESLVRVGLGAYGYNELPNIFGKFLLKPVLAIYAKKVSTKHISEGELVVEEEELVAKKDMNISTYDLGHGDGWLQGDSKHPYITSIGLPILGRVSTDFVSLESEMDVACIMHDAQISALQLNTTPYKVLSALSSDIEKIVV